MSIKKDSLAMPAKKKSKKKTEVKPELKRLSNSIGNFIKYFGFKEVHGQIWTHLWLSKEPLAAVDLCARLGVSKTLLSFSIAELLKYQVIQESGRGARRTTYYKTNPNITWVVLNVLRMRESMMISDALGKFQTLKASVTTKSNTELDLENLSILGDLIKTAHTAIESLLTFQTDDHEFSEQLKFFILALSQQTE